MFLNDIGHSPASQFEKINSYLEENYGFRISKNTSSSALAELSSRLTEEVDELKLNGADASTSPDIVKRLLILEGLRHLKEFVDTDFKSPQFETVVNALTEFVVDHFTVGGMTSGDFIRSLDRAMEEYRSSRYRFPDDVVREEVRERAMSELSGDGIMEASEPKATQVPGGRRAKKALDNLQDEPNKDEGTIMKEDAMTQRLRRLLENEVSQAEVMMAAKGFANDLQEMIEKIGRLQNEDLPPVTDQMRQTYGTDSASSFQTQIYGAFQSVMDSLYTAKNEVDDAVEMLAYTGKVGNLNDMERDGPKFGDDTDAQADTDTMASDGGADDLGMDDLDNLEEPDDGFGGAEQANPLGRSKKTESVVRLEQKVMEMRKMVRQAKQLREARV